jgi:hypothetical protein
MKVGIDSYCYHRFFGEVYPMQSAPLHRYTMDSFLNRANDLGCDGVHIGPDDASYANARRMVGPDVMIGVTCKNSRHLAMDLADEGADYVAFGAFYPTTTKDVAELEPADPEILSVWSETTNVPCVAIGGITVKNCEPLIAAGADRATLAAAGVGWVVSETGTEAVPGLNADYADNDLTLYRIGGVDRPVPHWKRIAVIVAHLVWAAMLVGSAAVLAATSARRGSQS